MTTQTMDAIATVITRSVRAAIAQDSPHTRALMRAIAPVIAEYVERHTAPLRAEIAALKARPPGVKYAGIWRHDAAFNEGDLCTHDSSLWLARSASCSVRPGADRSWVLIVKRGGA